jgi:hypothetical protein
MATIISSQGASRPAPKWWRNFERGMLLVMIPATVLVLQSWKFNDELQAMRIILIVNVALTALIKFIGMMLVDTDDNYVSNLKLDDTKE